MLKKELQGFIDFIQEKGIISLAIGFIIGGAVTKVVTALVQDILNPLIGLLLGAAGNLSEQYMMVGKAKVHWGNFVGTTIDFLIIAAVVYYGVKLLGIETPSKSKKK